VRIEYCVFTQYAQRNTHNDKKKGGEKRKMRKLITTLVFALGVLGLVSNAFATLINIQPTPWIGETNLWDVYNTQFGVLLTEAQVEANENDPAISLGLFTAASGTVAPVWRDTAFPLDIFYYVGAPPGTQINGTLPAGFGPLGGGPYSVPTAPTIFGLYGVSIGGTWYTEPWRNIDGQYHWVVLNHPTDSTRKLVGLEDDILGHADWDYNDFVFEVQNFEVPNIIPEPSSMMLLGMGILGLFRLRRRVA